MGEADSGCSRSLYCWANSRFISAPESIIVHSIQSVFVIVLVLTLVLD